MRCTFLSIFKGWIDPFKFYTPFQAKVCISIVVVLKTDCVYLLYSSAGVTWDFYPAHSLLSAVKDSADKERTGDELTALLDRVFYYITQLEDIDYKESQEGSFDESRTAHDKMAHGTRDSVLRHKIAQAHRSYFQTWKDVKTKEATKKGSQRERIIKVKDDVFGKSDCVYSLHKTYN